MMFYQLLTVAITLLNFSFKVSGTDDQFPVQHCKKKSPPTSRGSGESTQRFYPNGSQAQAFSIQYPHLDTTSWICLAVGIADTQGGPRIRFRKEVLGGLGGVLRGGFITWNEPRFCFTIPATITRKKKTENRQSQKEISSSSNPFKFCRSFGCCFHRWYIFFGL